jgi:hypothetical protein
MTTPSRSRLLSTIHSVADDSVTRFSSRFRYCSAVRALTFAGFISLSFL